MRVIVKTHPEAFKRVRTRAESLAISDGDLHGPILTQLGQVHRRQMERAFSTQGASTSSGRWAALHPKYAERKRRIVGWKKILELTGSLRKVFTRIDFPGYVQDFISRGNGRGIFRFGAYTTIGAAHVQGNPSLTQGRQSATARRVFGGVAPRLPVRDMISKTPQQIAEFGAAMKEWYIKRVRQVLRHQKRSR